MSRQHILRAWDYLNKKYFYNVENGLEMVMKPCNDITFLTPKQIEDSKRFELEEVIGMFDKNGQLIFENDIVTFKSFNPVESKYYKHFEKVEFCRGFYNICDLDSKKIEIVGNIHQNADLLKNE